MPQLLRTAALALLSISSAACTNFDRDAYLPTSPNTQNALELTVERSVIPADEFSTTRITARITPNAASTLRRIEFSTNTGTFVGASGTGRAIESVVSADGITSVELRSSRTVETATVTASVKDAPSVSRQTTVDFAAVAGDAIIRVTTGAAAVPADGASMTAVIAEIAAGLPSGRRQVTFTTSLGTFVADPSAPTVDDPNQKTINVGADGSNRAVAFLRSRNNEVGQAIVSAVVDTPPISANTFVQFTRALPDRVLVTTNAPTVAASFSSPILVTVTLVRDAGRPTANTIIRFRATDAFGNDRSFFTNVQRSDVDGTVTASFAPGPGTAPGPLLITATVDGTTISGTATVIVN